MAPPPMGPKSKQKGRDRNDKDEDEDVSQLRKPITIHGKPVEQILNSIHYGSPELRSLLLNECDIIFECKVCRALFRDLPNFIAHKRRFCSKSAAENNYFAISELPDERVVVVQPRTPVEGKLRAAKVSAQSAINSSGRSLEETVQHNHQVGEGTSNAFKVYSNAEAKLRHQRDHAKITSVRTTEIPGNSNAVFVNVSTTSVNIHERQACDGNPPDHKVSMSSRANRRKADVRSRSLERTNLRSKSSTTRTAEDSVKVSDMLMKELKVMQNRLRTKTQGPRQDKEGKEMPDRQSKETKDLTDREINQDAETKEETLDKERKEIRSSGVTDSPQSLQRQSVSERNGAEPHKEYLHSSSSSRHSRDRGSAEISRQIFMAESSKEHSNSESSKSSNDVGSVRPSRPMAEVKSAVPKQSIVVTPTKPSPGSSSSSSSDGGGGQADTKVSSGKSLICMKCRTIFSTKRSLKFHMKMQHSGNKMFFPCPLCSNIYCYVAAVRRHLEINHDKSKPQIKALREKIKSMAFSKFAPTPCQESVRSAKRTLVGTRQSLRDTDRVVSKKLNNASYLYSSVKKSKGLAAKKDPILQECSDTVKSLPAARHNLIDTPSTKSERGEESKAHVKSTRSHAKTETPEARVDSRSARHQGSSDNKPSAFPAMKSSSTGLHSEMQTCPKCSRLFGRKATFEMHIKVCEGRAGLAALGLGRKPPSLSIPEAGTGTSLKSTRNKSREDTTAVSSPKDALGKQNKGSQSAVGSSSIATRTSCITSREEKKSSDSGAIPSQPHSIPRVQHEGKVLSSSPSNSMKQMQSLVKSGERQDDHEDDTKSHSSGSESSHYAGIDLSSTLTRLKSKLSSDILGLRASNDHIDHRGASSSSVSSTSEDKGSDSEHGRGRTLRGSVASQATNTEDSDTASNTVPAAYNVLDRPRRKRKVPSRNIGAVEFLKKFHRLEDRDQGERRSPKSARLSVMSSSCEQQGGTETTSPAVSASSQQLRKSRTDGKKNVEKPSWDEVKEDFSSSTSVSRNRATAHRVFVMGSNDQGRTRAKLQCHNFSKVNKLIDEKKIRCLKCGAKFSILPNLRRHVMRSHLRWSRFKCKLCNYHSYDKSECNTHISRAHRRYKNKDNILNSLIVDLTQKGGEAMSIKKTKTMQAKSQQQDNEKDIYKNQTVQKVPRLSERLTPKTDTNSSRLLPSPTTLAADRLRSQPRAESGGRREMANGLGRSHKTNTAASTPTSSIRQSPSAHRLLVSHLVERAPRSSGTPQHSVAMAIVASQAETIINGDLNSDRNLSGKEAPSANAKTASSINPVSAVPSTTATTGRRAVLPFNISTRNSPRVFDTTPYNREEAAATTNTTSNVSLATRHSLYSKPGLVDLEKCKSSSQARPSSADDMLNLSCSVQIPSLKLKDDSRVCRLKERGDGSNCDKNEHALYKYDTATPTATSSYTSHRANIISKSMKLNAEVSEAVSMSNSLKNEELCAPDSTKVSNTETSPHAQKTNTTDSTSKHSTDTLLIPVDS